VVSQWSQLVRNGVSSMSQKNLLEQLKSMTVVVADTGDINSIE
jgi:hypothetical protein